ncbi:thioredoxin family protein [Treponema sp.]|uniref:thioredoxin family protein n=1 Tax=Treponema sp. TaxID=166 RepID=UPI002600F800|nr:thioredoxin family protein [Treponema sp.]MCR5218466.1 thioredoxin family protein [Treponema sp.]
MKMNKCILKLTAALALVFAVSSCSKKVQKVPELVWHEDFEAAKKAAAKENKGIMLLFTGSDWDKYSKKFKKNVVESEKFLIKFANDYVFVNLDFTEKEFNAAYLVRERTEEEQQRHEELQRRFFEKEHLGRDVYNVNQYPSVFFLTQEGWYLDSIIYTDEVSTFEGFEKTVHYDQIKKLSACADKIRESSGVEKAEAVNTFYETIPPVYISSITDLIENFPAYDPENKTGYLGKFEQAEAYFEAYALNSKGEDASVVYIKVAEDVTNHLSAAERQNMYSMAVLVKLQLGKDTGKYDYEGIINYLQKAYDIDPQNEIAPDILYQLEKAKQVYREQKQ